MRLTIDDHDYTISLASAGEGLRLLRGWLDHEAAMAEAMSAVYGRAGERVHAGWQLPESEGVEVDPQAAAVRMAMLQEQGCAIEAAEYRAKAKHLLSDDAIRDLIVPTLRLVLLHIGDVPQPLADESGGGLWQAHFSGRLGALFRLLTAAKDHNFADFFGASTDSGAGEAAEQPATTPARTGGSGRPSARATAR